MILSLNGIIAGRGVIPSTLLLDTYGGAAVAYSLRKLRTAYTGSAITVRRSSDNTSQNIGFDSIGNLDTTSLLSFVGSGNGFVSVWFDQSGNNRNAVQVTTTYQPKIVSSGVLNTYNGRPCVKFDGSDDYIESPYYTGTSNELYFVTQTTDTAFQFPRGQSGQGFIAEQGSTNTETSSYWITQPQLYVNSALTSPANRGDVYNLLNGYKLSVHKGANISNNWLYVRFGSFIQNGYLDFNGNLFEWVIYPTTQSSQNLIESNINSYYSIYIPVSDADAQAFITLANITDSTQVNAINQLVIDLKSANIWTKMKAIYPFVGGTASSHRFNLKDPRTVNEAFYLDFFGGGTHSDTGYQPNGNSYADTKLIPSTNLSTDSHISIYLNTLSSDSQFPYVMGSANGENQALAIRTYGNFDGYSRTYNNSQLNASNNIANSNGLWVSNIITGQQRQLRNNVLRASDVKSGTNPTSKTYISAINIDNVAYNYASQTTCLISMGDALSLAEETAFYNAVQAYQTTLGRQV